jgi:hypothetical protein
MAIGHVQTLAEAHHRTVGSRHGCFKPVGASANDWRLGRSTFENSPSRRSRRKAAGHPPGLVGHFQIFRFIETLSAGVARRRSNRHELNDDLGFEGRHKLTVRNSLRRTSGASLRDAAARVDLLLS